MTREQMIDEAVRRVIGDQIEEARPQHKAYVADNMPTTFYLGFMVPHRVRAEFRKIAEAA